MYCICIDRQQSYIWNLFFLKHLCATWSDLPSNISTMHWTVWRHSTLYFGHRHGTYIRWSPRTCCVRINKNVLEDKKHPICDFSQTNQKHQTLVLTCAPISELRSKYKYHGHRGGCARIWVSITRIRPSKKEPDL